MGLVLVFSELLVNDGGDDHIFCTLKIENKFVCFPMEEHHNISSWTLNLSSSGVFSGFA